MPNDDDHPVMGALKSYFSGLGPSAPGYYDQLRSAVAKDPVQALKTFDPMAGFLGPVAMGVEGASAEALAAEPKPVVANGLFTDTVNPPDPMDHAQSYPVVKGPVDGFEVGDEVSNMSSIGSSLDDWEEVPGIREVPMSHFAPYKPSYSATEQARTGDLAKEIAANKRIDPLIVVVDKQGPYILEGGHRIDALSILGKKSFPAKVVVDTSE